VIIRNDRYFGEETDPTEDKPTYVQPNRFGFSGDDPEPAWQSEPGKRLAIREVRGRLEVVECE
jgi:hypothetical protein